MMRIKRFLAMLLAVVLVVHLLPGNVFAITTANSETPEQQSNTSSETVLFSENFESWYDGTAQIGTTYSTSDSSSWNNANPADDWAIYVSKGGVLVQPASGVDASNGNVSMKLTPQGEANVKDQVYIRYNFPKALTSSFEKGAKYKVSFYAKSEEANYDVTLQYRLTAKDTTLYVGNEHNSLNNGAWKLIVFEFTIEDDMHSSPFLAFGMGGSTLGKSGSVYIDDVSIVRIADAPSETTVSIPETATVEVGKTTTLEATVTPSGSAITWISSNDAVATVDANGVVTGVAAGTATITATVGSVSASCAVTVTAAQSEPQSNIIWVESFEVGQSFEAITEDPGASVYDGNNAAGNWNGAQPVAALNNQYAFAWSSKTNGKSVTISVITDQNKAKDGNSFLAHTQNVEQSRLNLKFQLCNNAAVLDKMVDGRTYIVSVWVKQSETNEASRGMAKLAAKYYGNGNQVMAVTQGDYSTEWVKLSIEFEYTREDYFFISFETQNSAAGVTTYYDHLVLEEKVEAAPETTVSLPETATVEAGKTTTLAATVTPANSAITWTSSNDAVATVDANGVVTGVAAGTATITATVGSVSASCTVTVTAAQSEPVSNIVLVEDFEIGDTFVANSNNNDTESERTSAGAYNITWNGAEPIDSSLFGYYASKGHKATFTAGVGSAHSGNSCVAHTYSNNVSHKIYLQYLMYNNEAVITRMEDGATYRASVWFKQSGTGGLGQITVKSTANGDVSVRQTAVSTGWAKLDVEFVYEEDNKNAFMINIEPQKATAIGDVTYFDYLVVEKIADAPSTEATVSLPETATVEVGKTITLAATVTPSGSAITWTSSNDSIATVQNGVVTGVAEGTATITATVGDVSANCTVTVTAAPLQTISISELSVVGVNATVTLPATVTPAGATVTWTSSNPSVATVDANGVVTGVAAGVVTITATVGEASDTCIVTVTAPKTLPENVVLWESFEIGDTFMANANTNVTSTGTSEAVGSVTWNGAQPINPSYFGYSFTGSGDCTATLRAGVSGGYHGDSCVAHEYSVTNQKLYVEYLVSEDQDVLSRMEDGETYVVSVWVKQNAGKANGALVRLVVSGMTDEPIEIRQAARSTEWVELTAKFVYHESKKNDFKITIQPQNTREVTDIAYFDNLTITKLDQVLATDITIDETATVNVGKTVTLSPNVTPANSTTEITWTSSNTNVATVDANGVVTGVAAGEVTITATVDGHSDTCKVSVRTPSKYGVVFEESFESFADENTVITEIYSERGANDSSLDALVSWNGANVPSTWGTYLPQGNSVLLQPAVGTAHDGNVSIKLTPVAGSRMYITYTMPADDFADIVDGGRYRVTAWYKSEGANFNANMEIKAMPDNVTTKFVMTDGEWIKGSYEFTVDKSYGRVSLTFGIASPAGTKGCMYVDHITLERIPWVADITLDKTSSYLEVGDTLQLSYTTGPVGEESDVIFTSSDPSVAEVDANGKVTAKKIGTAEIIASVVNGKAATKCVVTVVDDYVELQSISLNKTTLNVNPGWQEMLTVSFNPSNAIEKEVVWSSSDESVVKVDEDGNILVLKTGTATIAATAPASGKTATCTVNAVDNPNFASTSKNVTVDFGKNETVDLSQILSGNYAVINKPAKGKVELSGNSLKYTAYTWLMDDVDAFVDQVYSDTVKVAVQNGDKSAVITLNITINKLADLFYDDNGEWITDVEMLFSQEYIDAIKAEIKNNPNGDRAKTFAFMLKNVDQFLNSTPLAYDYTDAYTNVAKYDSELRPVAQQTVNFLFAYLLTEDVEGYEELNARYLAKTIEWAKAALEYPYWGMRPSHRQNCDLPAGQFLFSTSMVYYWLKDELQNVTCTHIMGTDGTMDSVVTKKNVPMLDAMEERLWFVCSEMYTRNIGGTNLVGNHMHVRMCGLAAAAIVLRSVADTQEEQQNLITYTGMAMYNIGIAMHSLMPDGTTQEGMPYFMYTGEVFSKAGVLIRDVFGIDLFETTHFLERTGTYIMTNLLPKNYWTGFVSILNVGDSQTYNWYGPSNVLRFISGEYGDANALWLAQQLEAANIDAGYSQWMNVMFTDTSIQPEAPSQDSTLVWFKDMDHVLARTDWSGNEDLLSIKCGVPCGINLMQLTQAGEYPGVADAGHAHPDANHITLYSNGEFLLRDDGYSDKAAGNHNTLLVNGQGQLGEGGDWMDEEPYIDQDAIPYIKIANSTAAYDYIVGNATEAYDSTLGLELFERNILWLKDEQVLLVVDNIKAMSTVDLELRWFPYSKSVGVSGKAYMITGSKNTMTFYPLTEATTTTYEDVKVLRIDDSTTEKTFRQTYTGISWQNAVAFSWDAIGGQAAFVAYKQGENTNEHLFGVNGKIYTINVVTNEVTVTEGELDVEDDGSAGDSTLSTIMMNGVVLEDFDPSVTEYEVDRWWKTSKLDLLAYTNGTGATVKYEYDNKTPGTITITCTSKNGANKTVYTIHVTNSEKLLGIESVWTDSPREGYDIGWTYDSYITPDSKGNLWANIGLPTIIYDLGKVVNLEDVIIAFNLSAQRDSYYDLLYSIDGENWTYLKEDATVATTSGDYNGFHDPVKVVDDANVYARYVKVKLRGHNQKGDHKDDPGAYCSVQEITFIGTELDAGITVEGTNATVTDTGINNAILAAGTNNQVVLDVESVDDAVTKVIIPVDGIKDIMDGDKKLVIRLGHATLTFDLAALEAIVQATGNKATVELTVVPVEVEDLKDAQVKALKDYDVAFTFTVLLTCGDKTISNFGNGKVNVRIPFTPAEGTLASEYRIAYIADNGKVELLETVVGDGYLAVTLEHFSDYAIVRVQVEVPATGDIQMPMVMLAVLSVSLAAVLVVLVMKQKRYL